jgi:CubicO group peptidase (beta-lactamase class C family)
MWLHLEQHRHAVVELESPAFDQLQNRHCRQRFGQAGDAEQRIRADRLARLSIGDSDPRLEAFDKALISAVRANKVPGAALAVTRHGKLAESM